MKKRVIDYIFKNHISDLNENEKRQFDILILEKKIGHIDNIEQKRQLLLKMNIDFKEFERIVKNHNLEEFKKEVATRIFFKKKMELD